MDFERAAIKALFYDYPIEEFVRFLDQPVEDKKDNFLTILPQLVRWREHAFTMTEAGFIRELLEQQWMKVPPDIGTVHNIYRPFFALKYVAQKLLKPDEHDRDRYPQVIFDNLFRWKELTVFVGEDLLTTSFKAAEDKERTHTTSLFLWPDTLHHSNENLNRVLEKGLSDLHAHELATVDVFNLNWISLMNDIKHKSDCRCIRMYQELSVNTPKMQMLYPLERLCVAAAYLRIYFFTHYVLKTPLKEMSLLRVKDILIDDEASITESAILQTEIALLRRASLKTAKNKALDYAITVSASDAQRLVASPYAVFQGERNLMYTIFYQFYSGNKQLLKEIPYFYLYILIKNRIRREIVQINCLQGFENFQEYQNRKSIFVKKQDPIGENWHKLVARTTLNNANDKVELRMSPSKQIRYQEADFGGGIFGITDVVDKAKERISLVVHFIKPSHRDKIVGDNVSRYFNYRLKIKRQLDLILDLYKKQNRGDPVYSKRYEKDIPIVGIDTASMEMFCRPEVFGHIYRYAQRMGIIGRTYHVGEDFFDIVDGLRAIDEAIAFLELDGNCRLGHALALGVNAQKYYHGRRHRIIMPRQYLLDNYVWLYINVQKYDIKIARSFLLDLKGKAADTFEELGYSGAFNMMNYWESMQLRGNDPDDVPWNFTDWGITAIQKTFIQGSMSYTWFKEYQYNKDIKEKGNEIIEDRWPKGIEDVVGGMQAAMRAVISKKEITIECNPTSNKQIGTFDRYDEHPLIRKFYPIRKVADFNYPLVTVTINTDDRGVFATSLYDEFSLIALAIKKQKSKDGSDKIKNPTKIYQYIDLIRQEGFNHRFRARNSYQKISTETNDLLFSYTIDMGALRLKRKKCWLKRLSDRIISRLKHIATTI